MVSLLKRFKIPREVYIFQQTRSYSSVMSRTTITLKFKMCLLLDEVCSWAEKLLTDINLSPLMPDDYNNFGGS